MNSPHTLDDIIEFNKEYRRRKEQINALEAQMEQFYQTNKAVIDEYKRLSIDLEGKESSLYYSFDDPHIYYCKNCDHYFIPIMNEYFIDPYNKDDWKHRDKDVRIYEYLKAHHSEWEEHDECSCCEADD